MRHLLCGDFICTYAQYVPLHAAIPQIRSAVSMQLPGAYLQQIYATS